MCEFCENIAKDVPNWNFRYNNETDICPSGDAIDLLNVNGYIALVFTNSADEYEYGHAKVNYCPICGRDLRSEENEQND